MNLRGKFTTDADGRFWFRSVMMVELSMAWSAGVVVSRAGIPTGRRICTR